MAAPRPYWKGQLKLSLVSFPVELYSATAGSTKISFHQIHEPTGKRVRYEKTVPGVGPVDSGEIMKGFEYEKDNYVLLDDEELDAVKLETRKTMELIQFVDYDEVAPLYFERPYFMVPADEQAEEAFRVIRDALRETKKMGLGKLAIRGREYLAAVKPCAKGLLLETLRFEDEVREADNFFRDIGDEPAPEELLDVAKQLIERKTARFDPSAFKDLYGEALRALVDAKLKSRGRKVKIDKDERRPSGAQVIDLMGALKRSLETTGGDKKGREKKGGDKKPTARRKPAAKAKSASGRKKSA
jgi:DNA end-binding protein Ku